MNKNIIRRLFAYSVFIPIILFLIYINQPRFHPLLSEPPAKSSLMNRNMHMFQDFVEKYAAANKGHYPANIESLRLHAVENGYWRDFLNPFKTAKHKNNFILVSEKTYNSNDYFNPQLSDQKKELKERLKGYIIYVPIGSAGLKKYKILGIGKQGDLCRDREEIRVLENR